MTTVRATRRNKFEEEVLGWSRAADKDQIKKLKHELSLALRAIESVRNEFGCDLCPDCEGLFWARWDALRAEWLTDLYVGDGK